MVESDNLDMDKDEDLEKIEDKNLGKVENGESAMV